MQAMSAKWPAQINSQRI